MIINNISNIFTKDFSSFIFKGIFRGFSNVNKKPKKGNKKPKIVYIHNIYKYFREWAFDPSSLRIFCLFFINQRNNKPNKIRLVGICQNSGKQFNEYFQTIKSIRNALSSGIFRDKFHNSKVNNEKTFCKNALFLYHDETISSYNVIHEALTPVKLHKIKKNWDRKKCVDSEYNFGYCAVVFRNIFESHQGSFLTKIKGNEPKTQLLYVKELQIHREWVLKHFKVDWLKFNTLAKFSYNIWCPSTSIDCSSKHFSHDFLLKIMDEPGYLRQEKDFSRTILKNNHFIYDIHLQYSRSMCEDFPTEFSGYFNEVDFQKYRKSTPKWLNFFSGLIYCTKFKIVCNNKRMIHIQTFKGSCMASEIKFGVSQGYRFIFGWAMRFKWPKPVFKNTVLKILALRNNIKCPQSAQDIFCKFLLNALWGKLGSKFLKEKARPHLALMVQSKARLIAAKCVAEIKKTTPNTFLGSETDSVYLSKPLTGKAKKVLLKKKSLPCAKSVLTGYKKSLVLKKKRF